ncbi:conserved hypothetical protein [Vibrio jasicida]|uniref:hypothetical protein n=1 Tax=Vibrio jasicida TaxID=766224 RepID=UPI002895D373|nr:conserved hypothetical protein [Vibrio jasicida]CAH1607135.1 conserved hypothetical protein [Vibrio jasicida]
MSKKEVLSVLKESFTKVDEQEIKNLNPYIEAQRGDLSVVLDGEFSIEQLEALVVWMRLEKQG